MKELLPVLLFMIATICGAESWTYNGSSTEFIPLSRDLGENWSRSLIRTVSEENELKGLFQSTAPVALGPTTNYEIFRRKNKIRELSEVEFYFEGKSSGKQTYQMVILLFENHEDLELYWTETHPEQKESPVFTTLKNGIHGCIFRLQNIYVRVSSQALSTECERIAGMVFKTIELEQTKSNQSGDGNSE